MDRSEILHMLEDLGYVETVPGKEGYIPVEKTDTSPKVLEYNEKDTTPLWRKIKPDLIAKYRRKREIAREKGLTGIEGFFRVVCTKYIDPDIRFKVYPFRMKNLTFHVFSLKIDGDIDVRFENQSEEGQEGHCVVRRRYYRKYGCPEEKEQYQWEPVPGSADLLPGWDHSFYDDNTDTFLARIRKELKKKVVENDRVEVTGHWETRGLGNVFWTLLGYFRRGTVSTRNGFDLTIQYEFPQGNTKTINRHIDARVRVPVEGNIRVAWD